MYYFFIVLFSAINFFIIYQYLTSAQLNNYNRLKIIDKNNNRLIKFSSYLLAISYFASLTIAYFKVFYNLSFTYIVFAIESLLLLALVFQNKDNFKKNPLVFTHRAVRLILITKFLALIYFICCILMLYFKKLFMAYMFISLTNLFAIIFVWLALVIINPFEKSNNQKYIKIAEKKLDNDKLLKIAITGSYGKTSVKNILSQMLNDKFYLVSTPKNYNTPMGIVKSCNELNDNTEIFIAELGARHKNDIKELAEIIKPDIAILTGICEQHLETFLTIDNIIQTKYELVENLKDDGVVFFNVDNSHLENLFKKVEHEKYCSSIEYGDCHAKNIKYSQLGTKFELIINGQKVDCKTCLLGKGNLSNILLCCMVSNYLGLTLNEIADKIANLKPAEHRLQVINANGLTIIDDSYNANEIGARNALDVLELFDSRKVLITSGIVEAGKNWYNKNYMLGKEIAKYCDFVIVLGEKIAEPVYRGIVESNNLDRQFVVREKDIETAKNNFSKYLKNGDVLLIMTDLPDNYI